MAMTDFAVIGFPKCGTSAAVRLFEALPGINLCRMNGALESPFYANDRSLALLKGQHRMDAINGHKSTAYIYMKPAILRIKRDNPGALLVVCVRNPAHSLISWWQMHKRIATRGEPKTHFVNESAESRDFYLNATVDDYYRSYARDRLAYSKFVRRLCNDIAEQEPQRSRVLVLAQEYLAANSRKVAEVFASLVGAAMPASFENRPAHVSAAEKVERFPGSQEVLDLLVDEKCGMEMLFGELADRPNVTLLI